MHRALLTFAAALLFSLPAFGEPPKAEPPKKEEPKAAPPPPVQPPIIVPKDADELARIDPVSGKVTVSWWNCQAFAQKAADIARAADVVIAQLRQENEQLKAKLAAPSPAKTTEKK